MKIVVRILLGVALLPLAASQQCQPGVTCSLPNCRCWDDRTIPGGITREDTPQVILLTFQGTVNSLLIDKYNTLLENVKNPNGCPALATFFVQPHGSQMDLIGQLASQGHEIGISSLDGKLPQSEQQWKDGLTDARDALAQAGVQKDEVIGVRAPELSPGGQAEFEVLRQENFLYDASCATSTYDEERSLLWPFTYDFVPGPKCDIGHGPDGTLPGLWQFMVADLEFNGIKCASPSACTQVTSQRDAFDLFYNSFVQHYEGSRSPYMMVIDPQWALDDAKREGTRQFLEYVRTAFEETWLVTVSQALAWVKDPVPNANATADYPPWSCP